MVKIDMYASVEGTGKKIAGEFALVHEGRCCGKLGLQTWIANYSLAIQALSFAIQVWNRHLLLVTLR